MKNLSNSHFLIETFTFRKALCSSWFMNNLSLSGQLSEIKYFPSNIESKEYAPFFLSHSNLPYFLQL